MKPDHWADPVVPPTSGWRSAPASDGRIVPSVKSRVSDAIAHMRANIADENLDLEQIAAICGLCRFQTTRAFRRVTGVTPNKFLYALRILRAKQLLAETPMSITEICLEVGYTGLGTFISRFNHSVGLAPSSYRRYVQGNPSFLMALLDCLVQMRRARQSGPSGFVQVPPSFSGLVFLGAFCSSVPEGVPLGCTLANEEGNFVLPDSAARGKTLFALGVPWKLFDLGLASPEKLPRAIIHPMPSSKSGVGPTLALRDPDFLQPPILICLPVLIERMCSRVNKVKHEAPHAMEITTSWPETLTCLRN